MREQAGVMLLAWTLVTAGISIAATAGCAGEDEDPTEITIRVFPEGVPSFNGQTANAGLVAFHQGDAGGWLPLTGADGIYRATATGSRYMVAVGCAAEADSRSGTTSGTRLYLQAVSDTTDLHVEGCPREPQTVPVTAKVDGVPAEGFTQLWLGNATTGVLDGQAVDVPTPRGAVDVLATTHALVPGTDERVPVRAYRVPEPIDLDAARSLTLDYGALAQPFESHALHVTGFDRADGVAVHSSYWTPHSLTQWPLVGASPFDETHSSEPDTTYVTLDPRMRRPGDLSNVRVFTASSSGDRTFGRYVRLAMKDPVAQTVTLPAPLLVEPPVLDSAQNPQATVTIPIMPATLQTADTMVALITETAGSADERHERLLVIRVLSGWAEGRTSVSITTPDLSTLPGWDATMGLHSDTSVAWVIERNDRTMPYDTVPVDGRQVLSSRVMGEILDARPAAAAQARLRDVGGQLAD